MRDIADTLAFLAIKTLTDGGFRPGDDRKAMRRALGDAFEDLLTRLPEGTVAPRPPLGYVVGYEMAHGWTFNRDYGGPDRTRAGAEQELANEADEDPSVDWKLLEVREVQP